MMSNDMLDWLYQRTLMRRKALSVYSVSFMSTLSKHDTVQPRVFSVAGDRVQVCLSSVTFMTDSPSSTYGEIFLFPFVIHDSVISLHHLTSSLLLSFLTSFYILTGDLTNVYVEKDNVHKALLLAQSDVSISQPQQVHLRIRY